MSVANVRLTPCRRLAFIPLAALLLLTAACGGNYVSRGSDLYSEGRFIEAAEVFERTEARLESSSSSEQARFGLYRGATFLKLGDLQHASRWLGYARTVLKRNPEALSQNDAELLTVTLKELASANPPLLTPQDDAAVAAQGAGVTP